MPDATTTLGDLKKTVAAFAEERDWMQFHSLKNLAVSVSIEAAELLERFQWLDNAESNAVVENPSKRQPVEDELADVVIYALQLANQAEIDLSEAITRKMTINAEKYPIEKSKGTSEKYDSL